MQQNQTLVAIAVVLMTSSPQVARADVVAEIKQMELDARSSVVKVAPFVHLPSWNPRLTLVNTSWREIDFTLTALDSQGSSSTLGAFAVAPASHRMIPLPDEALAAGISAVVLRYVDLPDALGGMVTFEGPASVQGQLVAFPFKLVGSDVSAATARFFWGEANSAANVEIHVVNGSDDALEYVVDDTTGKSRSFRLTPWASARHPVAASTRTASVRRLGETGNAITWGLARLGHEPIALEGTDAAAEVETRTLVSTHIPSDDGLVGSVVISAANDSDDEATVPVQLVSNESGSLVAADNLHLAPGASVSFFPHSVWPHVDDWSTVRLEIGPALSSVQVYGHVVSPAGATVELSFQPISTAHASGMYPVPSLEARGAALYLVNVGSEPSEVLAELSWSGGQHSFEPFVVQPGSGYTLDLRSLATESEEYRQLQPIPRDFDHGFLKWLVVSGGTELLGRTEIIHPTSGDRVGMNCLQCCWRFPVGLTVPTSVTLDQANVSKTFQTSVRYDTCWGTMGPSYFSGSALDYSSPYSWNKRYVSASSGAEEDLSFAGLALGLDATCDDFLTDISGTGRVDACKLFLKSTHCSNYQCSPAKTCTRQTTSCRGCQVCCNKIRSYWTCKRRRQDLVASEYNACIGNCAVEKC